MERPADESATTVSGQTKVVVGVVSGSHFVNHMFLVVLPPILGLLATDFGVTLATLGLALGVQGGVNMIAQLPFGYVSDNYSRVLTLGSGLTLCAGGTFAIAAAPAIEWVFAGQALIGMGLAAHHPVHFPLLSDAVDEARRGRAFSVHGFAGQLGAAGTPAIITIVLLVPGTTWRTALTLIGGIGLLYAVAFVLLMRLKVADDVLAPVGDPEDDYDPDLDSVFDRALVELRSLLASPAILALAFLAFVTGLANWGVRSYAVVLLTDGYGLSVNVANATYTALFVFSAIVTIVGGILADRLSAQRVILVGFAVLLVSAALVGSLLLPPILAVVVLVVTAGSIAFTTPAHSKLTDALSERSNIGMNFALITVGVASAGAIAPPVFGSIITRFDLTVGFYGVALLAVVGAGLTVLVLNLYRETLSG